MSPYTAIIRRSGNPFELAHVLVSWLVGAGYDAYVVVGCAMRDTCLAVRYRTVCPEIPDETVVSECMLKRDANIQIYHLKVPSFQNKYYYNIVVH